MDEYPEQAFFNVGTLDDVIAKAREYARTKSSEGKTLTETEYDDMGKTLRDKYGYGSITRGVVLGNNLTGNLHEEDGFEPFKR